MGWVPFFNDFVGLDKMKHKFKCSDSINFSLESIQTFAKPQNQVSMKHIIFNPRKLVAMKTNESIVSRSSTNGNF